MCELSISRTEGTFFSRLWILGTTFFAIWAGPKQSRSGVTSVKSLKLLLILLTSLVMAACAAAPAVDMVPEKLADRAKLPDMPTVRIWGDRGGTAVQEVLRAEADVFKAKYAKRSEANLLALSGGGDDGAFGAGLIVGWGARGDRPVFDLVTGISAGSLIAPFAFLGREGDRGLSEIFVKHGSEEIYQANIVASLFGSPSLADNAPLARIIERYVDEKMLHRIADERAKGRLLLVGTTNLNAQRPVYWDMGKIAQQRTPQSLALFRKILLASAALPGIFPPVEIDVVANGKRYDEMHVDGGPTHEVFLSPADFSFRQIDEIVGRPIKRRLWVVRNTKMLPEYAEVQLTAVSIAARSLETLTKNQGIGDVMRIYDRAQADGMDFNLAYVPADFMVVRPKPFDRGYMTALYTRGYQMGRNGYPWAKSLDEIRRRAPAKAAAR